MTMLRRGEVCLDVIYHVLEYVPSSKIIHACMLSSNWLRTNMIENGRWAYKDVVFIIQQPPRVRIDYVTTLYQRGTPTMYFKHAHLWSGVKTVMFDKIALADYVRIDIVKRLYTTNGGIRHIEWGRHREPNTVSYSVADGVVHHRSKRRRRRRTTTTLRYVGDEREQIVIRSKRGSFTCTSYSVLWYYGLESGCLEYTMTAGDGRLNGVMQFWNFNGQLMERAHWKNGRRDGVLETWALEWEPSIRTLNEETTPRWCAPSIYLRNKMNYKDGKKHGVCDHWAFYVHGVRIRERFTYQNGVRHGVNTKVVEPDGQMLWRAQYIHGTMDGRTQAWYRNGEVRNGEVRLWRFPNVE